MSDATNPSSAASAGVGGSSATAGVGGPGSGAGAGSDAAATSSASAQGASCAVPSAVAAPAAAGAAPAGTPAQAGRTWQGPTAPQRLGILRRAKSIAIVGASNNPARASYFVGTYLLSSSPYDVYFVNPMADEILGHKAYASLADLPVVPDIVDVFRKHDDLPGVAREAVEVGAKALWLQLGSWNEEAAAIAEAAGLDVVMDRCVKIEHARFHGGLHLAGFDTGVISSKRQVTA